jgi:hypothetical protein
MLYTQSIFTIFEYLERLDQLSATGCLHVFNTQTSGYLFLHSGLVVHAMVSQTKGTEALDQVLESEGTVCIWIPEIVAAETTLNISIRKYLLERSIQNDELNALLHGKKTQALHRDPATEVAGGSAAEIYFLTRQGHPDLPLVKSGLTLGRDPDCDLVIKDLSISRKHLVVQISARGLHVIDLGSTNGTLVDGKPLDEHGLVAPGQLLRVGEVTFKVVKLRHK